MKKEVCWKCRWLIVSPGGFFRRKTKRGPCDKCLGWMTAFQQADQKRIWLKLIPPKKKKVEPAKKEDRKER